MALRTSGTCVVCGFTLVLLFALGGCLAPIALHRAVLQYDRTTAQIQAEMLLLNIARSKNAEPLHFTSVSSVAATFNFETSVGIAPAASNTETLVAPVYQTTVAENPTITIIPVEGEEFARRILSPIDQEKVIFLAGQGITPGLLGRLLFEELIVIEEEGTRVIRNNPIYKDEYTEFRRRALHIAALRFANTFHVSYLDVENILPLAIPLDTSPEHGVQALDQILRAEERGYTLKQDPDTRAHILAKKVSGPLVGTNYPLADLPNEEKRRLMKKTANLPASTIFLDIRPGYPGGDYPLHGLYKLRSFQEILQFVALINSAAPEFDVQPDPRSGPVEANPTLVLEIEETADEPANAAFKVKHGGLWHWIKKPDAYAHPTHTWNMETFRALMQLYEMTKADVSQKPTPAITIAK